MVITIACDTPARFVPRYPEGHAGANLRLRGSADLGALADATARCRRSAGWAG
jgi:hypothetical protein